MNPPINPIVVKDGAGLDRMGRALDNLTAVGYDTETNIVEKFRERRIRLIQIGNKHEQYLIDLLEFAQSPEALIAGQGSKGAFTKGSWAEPVVKALRPTLESNRVRKLGVNLIFDYIVSRWCLGLRPWHFYDCQLAEKVRWMGQVGFYERDYWALDDLTARYCGLLIDKSQQKTFDLSSPLTQEQIEYAALDVRLPFAIEQGQKKPIEEAGLTWPVQIDSDAIPAFGDLHINGFHISSDMWLGLVEEARRDYERLLAEMDTYFIPVVGRKGVTAEMLAELDERERVWKAEKDRVKRAELRVRHADLRRQISALRKMEPDCMGQANLNYSSPDQLLAALHKLKGYKSLADTSDKSFETLEGDPLVDAIREFRSAEKIVDDYGEKWIATNVDPVDSRIHATFQIIGADTGRTSCEKPNVQNILKGKNWRGCFVAPQGKRVVSCDWSGQELRILCDFSGEESWLEAFDNDWDVHSMCTSDLETEKWLAGAMEDCAYFAENAKRKCKCAEHEEHRDKFKKVNFGIPYGKSEYALRHDLKCSLAEAKDKLAAWYKKYAKNAHFLNQCSKDAREKGEVRTRTGRRRLFPRHSFEQVSASLAKKLKRQPSSTEVMKALRSRQNGIEREGKNTPIQGTGTEMLKLALGCGFDNEGKPFLWHVLEPEYDALLVNEVHDEIVAEAHEHNAEIVKDAMLDAMLRAGGMVVKSVKMIAEGKVSDKWKK